MLLSKLNYYGIKDTALNWFKSYLTNRTQYVDCNGISSSIREMETGVPQGSILDACECLMLLIEIMDKGFGPCPTNDNINSKGSFSELLFSFVLEKYAICDICTMKSPVFKPLVCYMSLRLILPPCRNY